MKNRNPKRNSSREQEIRYLENQLHNSLRPVSPRPDFVRDLKRQLNTQFDKLPSISQISQSNMVLILIAMLVCVFLIVFLSIRAALTLIGAFSLMYQYRRQAKGEKGQPIGPGN